MQCVMHYVCRTYDVSCHGGMQTCLSLRTLSTWASLQLLQFSHAFSTNMHVEYNVWHIHTMWGVCVYIYTYAYTVASTVAEETRTGSQSQKTLVGQDRSSWRWLDPFLWAAFCGFCSLFWSWPIDFLASNFHRLGNMLGQILGDILPHHRERTASIPAIPGCWLVSQLPFSFQEGIHLDGSRKPQVLPSIFQPCFIAQHWNRGKPR